MSDRRKPAPDPYDPRAHGCACRVCKDVVTVDLAALEAVPEEVAAAFLEASFEAAHAWKPGWPFADEDAYVRGGIAAITPMIEQQARAKVADQARSLAAQLDRIGPDQSKALRWFADQITKARNEEKPARPRASWPLEGVDGG